MIMKRYSRRLKLSEDSIRKEIFSWPILEHSTKKKLTTQSSLQYIPDDHLAANVGKDTWWFSLGFDLRVGDFTVRRRSPAQNTRHWNISRAKDSRPNVADSLMSVTYMSQGRRSRLVANEQKDILFVTITIRVQRGGSWTQESPDSDSKSWFLWLDVCHESFTEENSRRSRLSGR